MTQKKKKTVKRKKKQMSFFEISEKIQKIFKEAIENGEIKKIVQADR